MIGSTASRPPFPVTLDNWQTAAQLGWTFRHIAEIFPTAPISRGSGRQFRLLGASTPVADVELPRRGRGVDHGRRDHEGHRDRRLDGACRTAALLAEHYPGAIGAGHAAPADVGQQVDRRHRGRVRWSARASSMSRRRSPLRAGARAERLSRRHRAPPARHALGHRILRGLPRPDGRRSGYSSRRSAGHRRRSPDVPHDASRLLAHAPPGRGRTAAHSTTAVARPTCWAGSCEAAAGRRFPELAGELIWSRLGAEFDANIGVDSEGTGMFDGGISAALW